MKQLTTTALLCFYCHLVFGHNDIKSNLFDTPKVFDPKVAIAGQLPKTENEERSTKSNSIELSDSSFRKDRNSIYPIQSIALLAFEAQRKMSALLYLQQAEEIALAEKKQPKGIVKESSRTEAFVFYTNTIALIVIFSSSISLIWWKNKSYKSAVSEVQQMRKEQLALKQQTEVAEAAKQVALKEIERLKEVLENIPSASNTSMSQMLGILETNYITEEKWILLLYHFNQLHDGMTDKLIKHFPKLSPNEVRLSVLVYLGFSNRKIAEVRNITIDGVKKGKQRLLSKTNMRDFDHLWAISQVKAFA